MNVTMLSLKPWQKCANNMLTRSCCQGVKQDRCLISRSSSYTLTPAPYSSTLVHSFQCKLPLLFQSIPSYTQHSPLTSPPRPPLPCLRSPSPWPWRKTGGNGTAGPSCLLAASQLGRTANHFETLYYFGQYLPVI